MGKQQEFWVTETPAKRRMGTEKLRRMPELPPCVHCPSSREWDHSKSFECPRLNAAASEFWKPAPVCLKYRQGECMCNAIHFRVASSSDISAREGFDS